MLVVMETRATREMVDAVVSAIAEMGLKAHPIPGANRTAIGITGNKERISSDRLRSLPGVQELVHVTEPYKLVGRDFHPEDSVVDVGGVKVGGADIVFMAGPCSVEDRETTLEIARRVRAAGAQIFRGGAFKPRTSPYSFQGHGQAALETLDAVREETGLRIVTEAIDPENLRLVARYADMIQIGARNMQNFSLLREAGRSGKPILLKRGMSSTLQELLMAAEYVMSEDNPNVILCERGVRTFADHTRNTMDLSAVPFVKAKSHLPIIADPSHGTGVRSMVTALARASLAAGADGLLIEAHVNPDRALSDGYQTITTETLAQLVEEGIRIADILGRRKQED
ncbi:MAG TPA: 3-deoxy-7-phosphoheptulonate synthase [candidate division Zixibacteria bacterium]|nr:3-deoxy-7-phosphoheptulonate synthase [candidate division Zixibacteria bacterium]